MEVDGVSSTTTERGLLWRSNRQPIFAFEVLQSLREDGHFFDVKLETDDAKIVFGHKLILSSASPYFKAMFTTFHESHKDSVHLRELDSHTLKLLVDYMYTGQITITGGNIKLLLPAARLLQLDEVQDACCNFLETQLNPTNCLGIMDFAGLHDCKQLVSSSESYIKEHFSEVVEGDEFLSLSSEQVVKIISSDVLTVPSEDKVFECVIRWVNHMSDCRKDLLSKLMGHVRLPLASKQYILKRLEEEPLLKNSFECKKYIIEALHFHCTIPKTICSKPRQPVRLPKVILVIGGENNRGSCKVEWFDPETCQWKYGPEMRYKHYGVGLAALEDCVFALGGYNNTNMKKTCTVEMLDLTSPTPGWVSTVPMLSKRAYFGVAVLGNCIYAIGGHVGNNQVGTAEVFDCRTKVWRMISNMSSSKLKLGVGILNNLLYVVGGYDPRSRQVLKTVEYYNPRTDRWTLVAEMCVRRCGVGIGILDGAMYAVGGWNGSASLKSVEVFRPCIGVWTPVADMHMCRSNAGVVAFDGLLYVVGGANLASVEIYDPSTNTWSISSVSMCTKRSDARAVVIIKPPYFIT